MIRTKCVAFNEHAHKKRIINVQCHPSGKIICTRGYDNKVNLWHVCDLSVSKVLIV